MLKGFFLFIILWLVFKSLMPDDKAERLISNYSREIKTVELNYFNNFATKNCGSGFEQ